jgi:hypothetical protein
LLRAVVTITVYGRGGTTPGAGHEGESPRRYGNTSHLHGRLLRVLRPPGIATVHYAQKRKRAGRLNPNFSSMTAEKMEAMAPMQIVDHETRMLKHSNIVVFQKPADSVEWARTA